MANAILAAPIRLLILDVDGTLVGSDLEVTPQVKAALEAVRQRGVQIALCTGRPEMASLHYIKGLGLDGHHIFDSGATVRNPATGETLYHKGVPTEAAVRIVEYARKHQIYLEVYSGSSYYVDRLTEASAMHTELQRWSPELADIAEIAATRPITKLESIVINDEEGAAVGAMLDYFVSEVDHSWAIAPGLSWRFVNILNKGVDKGEAVAQLIAHTGIPAEQVMGVGDGPNDEPLLRSVGLGIAMGNAAPSLKEKARWVTAPVEENGLALAIEEFILNHWR